MTETKAKEILTKVLISIIDNGEATISIGTEESKALIRLVFGEQK